MAEPTSQFWLPHVFDLDGELHGGLADPVSLDADGNPHPAGETWLGAMKMKTKHVDAFLLDIAPALNALLLAGYRVSYVELGFESLAGLGALVDMSEHWLRIDLQNRRIEVTPRADIDDLNIDGQNVVRLSLQPIEGPAGNFAIELSEARMDAFIVSQGSVDLDRTAAAFLDETFGPDVVRPTNSGQSIKDWRHWMLTYFARGLATDATPLIPVCVRYDQTGRVPAARDVLLRAAKLAVFDSVRWYVGSSLVEDAETAMYDYEGLVEETTPTEEEDSQAAPSPVLPLTLPGMLWALNPANWETTARDAGVSEDGLDRLSHLVHVASLIYDDMARPGTCLYSDLVHERAAEIDLGNNEIEVGGEIAESDVQPIKSIDLLGLSSVSADFRTWSHPDRIVHGYIIYRVVRFIDQQLGAPDVFTKRATRKSNRNPGNGKFGEFNPSLTGTLRDTPVAWTDAPEDSTSVVGVKNTAHEFFGHMAQLLAIQLGEDEPGRQSEKIARKMKEKTWIDVVFSLFNFGIFSIEHLTGDLNADYVPPDVIAYRDGDTIVLEHSRYVRRGVELSLSADLGHSLDDSVAWEFVAAPPAIDDPDMQAMLATLDPALAAAAATPVDRLVIVAAPGVKIVNVDWPSTAYLDVYRVQSHALVPAEGDSINTSILMAPWTLSPDDDLEPSARSRDLAPLLTHFETSPSQMPSIAFKPFRKDGKQGFIVSNTPKNDDYWRGVDGKATVEITVPALSGSERVAVDLRTHVIERVRQTGTRPDTLYDPETRTHIDIEVAVNETVDIVQYELVIHRTPGIDIKIADDNIGFFSDHVTGEVDETFIYTVFTGPIAAIDVQGVMLEVDTVTEHNPETGEDFDKLVVPYRHTGEGALDLVKDPGPLDAAKVEALIEQAQFAFDMAWGFIPVVGDATDAAELLLSFGTGTDKWGRPITNLDRTLMVGGMLLPFVSSKTMRAIKGTVPDADTVDPDWFRHVGQD